MDISTYMYDNWTIKVVFHCRRSIITFDGLPILLLVQLCMGWGVQTTEVRKSLYVLLSNSQARPGRNFSQPRTKTFSQLCMILSKGKELIYKSECIYLLYRIRRVSRFTKTSIMAGCSENCKEGCGICCLFSAYLMCMVCCPCFYFCFMVKCCHCGPWLGGEIDEETPICFKDEDCCGLCGLCTDKDAVIWASVYFLWIAVHVPL